MFIKIADREISPATLVLGRLAFAALTLALVVPLAIGGRRRSPSCGHTGRR